MFEIERPFFISICVVIILCLIIGMIKLLIPDYKIKQINSFDFTEILFSLEILVLFSVMLGYNIYRYMFNTYDMKTMIESDKILITNK
jgi:hypothetical protein